MSFVKLAMACGLVAVAVGVSGCGIKPKPLAGTQHLDTASGNHAYVDDPRLKHTACLAGDGIHFTTYRTKIGNYPAIQIGALPAGPTVIFQPTPGAAQGIQMAGQAQSAEVIGAALMYPHQDSDGQLKQIESCMALGVDG